jgi:PadR family transcriptional regulator PadR
MARQDDSENRRSQLLKGLGELALLGLLKSGPAYGLQILDGLRQDAGLQIAEGSIYPLLHRLERAGMVRSKWTLEDEGARPRKYYALTDEGSVELEAVAAEWMAVSASLTAFLQRRLGT